MLLKKKIICSFDHGYFKNVKLPGNLRPSILMFEKKGVKKYSYTFLRTPLDFINNKNLVTGELPKKNKIKKFKKLPRFGFTGLAKNKKYIFAGSWNAIYVICRKDMSLKKIISNRLTSDIHGIDFYKNKIYTTLSFRDTLVITNLDGSVDSFYSIDENLDIKKNDKNIFKNDWRFVSKQRRGPTGNFHFNFVKVLGSNIYLTSRNLSGVIKLNIKSKKSSLMTLGHMKCNLIHDGVKDNKFTYFTSIDGKILIVNNDKKKSAQEKILKKKFLFKNFKNSHYIRYFQIDKSNLKRYPTWCRGIEIIDKNKIITTVDGVYGSKGFSVVCFDIKRNKKLFEYTFKINKNFEHPKFIKYVSGFGLMSI